jgi:glycosyltransferase involved in cell wall biosynthesis
VVGRSVLDRRDADVCVLDSICAAYAAPWLALDPPRVPLAAMLHQPPGGIDHGRLRSGLQSRLDLLAYSRCEAILLASAALEGELPAALATRTVVVAPGSDAPGQTRPAANMRAGRDAAVLCVGNWVARKGILELLDAFAALPPGAATLHLAGDPHIAPRYGRRVHARLSRPDLRGRVVVHGAVQPEQVQALLAGADVFALASTREPYGTVYGEALARGLPTVGWRAGNLPHLIDHGVEGLMAEPGDVAGLSGALARLCRDERLRAAMSEAARRAGASLPTWEESARRFFATLAVLVDR